MTKHFICVFVFCFSLALLAQTQLDTVVFNQKRQIFYPKAKTYQRIGLLSAAIAKSFTGTPYEGQTLETEREEKLIINLHQLDCTTLVENVLALAVTFYNGKDSFEAFSANLQKIRYRNGKILGYASRLHYFSDWIFDNQKKGLITDITKDLGGRLIKFPVNFMSTHPESYRQLGANPQIVPAIESIEKAISKRDFYYIPKSKISEIQDKLQDGDFIAITTSIAGMDIGHVGIVVKVNGKTHFLHAPNVGSSVQITAETLSDYLNRIKKHTGIIVFRPVVIAEK